MKKILSLITALLILAAVPMSAFAVRIDVYDEFYEDGFAKENLVDSGYNHREIDLPEPGTKISVNDFEKHIEWNGQLWDLKGINNVKTFDPLTEIPAMPEYGPWSSTSGTLCGAICIWPMVCTSTGLTDGSVIPSIISSCAMTAGPGST